MPISLLRELYQDNATAQRDRHAQYGTRNALAVIPKNEPPINLPLASERIVQIERFLHRCYADNIIINDDFVLRQLDVAGLSIYDHMLDTDGHLYAASDTLVGGAAGVGFHIKAAASKDQEQNEQYKTHADFIRECFDLMDFQEELKKPYWSHPKGFSLCEIVYSWFDWKPNKRKLHIKSLYEIPIDTVVFDTDYKPRIRTTTSAIEGIAAKPDFKFLFMRRGSTAYGQPLLRRCYKSWWFKLNGQVFAMKYMQGWSNPRTIAYHDTQTQMEQNMEMLEMLAEKSIASLPRLEGMAGKPIDILESGQPYDFRQMNTYWDDENSKVMTSSTRTLSASDAVGTHAATADHMFSLNERQFALAVSGRSQVVNGQIIRNLIDLNFGPQLRYPSYELGREEEESPAGYLDNWNKAITGAVAGGIPLRLSIKEFRDRTGLDEPRDDTDAMIVLPKPTGSPGAGSGLNFH